MAQQRFDIEDEMNFDADKARAEMQLADFTMELGELATIIDVYDAVPADDQAQWLTDNGVTAQDVTDARARKTTLDA
jgi:hypothetical protein